MAKKGYTPEQIINKLREAEVLLSQGATLSIALKRRRESGDRETFTTLKEARVLIEQWRQEYNQVRPHSSLGYRPPAPEAILTGVTT